MRLPIVVAAPPGARGGAVADLLARDQDVLRAADVASALRECRRSRAVAAVLPFPGGAEDEVLRFLGERGRRTAVFLYTEPGQAAAGAERVLSAGARGVTDAAAPDFADDLCRRLTGLVRRRRLRDEEDRALAALFARFELAGRSPAMRDVFRRALKASRFADLPVLVEGARGTPKRRLVSAILHLDPARAPTPFIALDGRDAGRILGSAAGDPWQALLRAGRGGTVFLDRVEALLPEWQRALAAVICRRPAGPRVIAATERPADELVADGVLDAELCMALSLFRVPLPSLGGRPEDVAAQALRLLRAAATEEAPPATGFEPGLLDRLGRLPWPGNTAELEGVLRPALAGARGRPLCLEDQPAPVRDWPADAPLPEPVPHPGGGDDDTPADVAAEFERRLLRSLLSRQDESVRPDHEVGGESA